jgi:hypothetical protein
MSKFVNIDVRDGEVIEIHHTEGIVEITSEQLVQSVIDFFENFTEEEDSHINELFDRLTHFVMG